MVILTHFSSFVQKKKCSLHNLHRKRSLFWKFDKWLISVYIIKSLIWTKLFYNKQFSYKKIFIYFSGFDIPWNFDKYAGLLRNYACRWLKYKIYCICALLEATGNAIPTGLLYTWLLWYHELRSFNVWPTAKSHSR